MKHRFTGKYILILLLCAAFSACGKAEPPAPELHTIAAGQDAGMADELSMAAELRNALDHPASRYYVINDYYNMESKDGLHILPHFATHQQMTEYSCGCAAALMVLRYYGIQDYSEQKICELAGTDPEKGTSPEGLAAFFEKAGLRIELHADTKPYFASLEDMEAFLIEKIDSKTPVMVDWVDWTGHWQIIIGLDTCGTDDPYDDVLIMADSYDVTDHYQDGYYTVPLGRFAFMWREGPCAGKEIPYEQPFVIAYRPQ